MGYIQRHHEPIPQYFGEFYQTVDLPFFGDYTLTFYEAGRDSPYGNGPYQVLLDSVVLADLSTTHGQQFTQETVEFQADAGIHTLKFRMDPNDPGPTHSVFIDNVSLVGTPTSGSASIKGLGGGLLSVNIATVVITVNPTNDAPEFTIDLDDVLTDVDENTPYIYTLGYGGLVRAEDIDVDDVLKITAPTLPSWLALVDNNDGTATLMGTPVTLDRVSSPHPVLLKVEDLGGLYDTQEFSIGVSEVSGATVELEEWRKKHFGKDLDQVVAIAADDANPDHDQLVNLLEYYMGLDPLTNDDEGVLTLSFDEAGSALVCVYRKSTSSGDTVGQIEWSSDGQSWTASQVTRQVVADLGGVLLIEARIPVGDSGSQLVRLKVSR